MKTIDEALGRGKKFYENAEEMEKEKIIGKQVCMIDATIIEDWEGDYGTSDVAIIAFKLGEKEEKTYRTMIGGKAILRTIRQLLKKEELPGRIAATLKMVKAEKSDKKYYKLI